MPFAPLFGLGLAPPAECAGARPLPCCAPQAMRADCKQLPAQRANRVEREGEYARADTGVIVADVLISPDPGLLA